MALNPIDMKGFIPKTQELSEYEGHKTIRDRGQVMAQQAEQDRRADRAMNKVEDSGEAEKARIRKDCENGTSKDRKGKDNQADSDVDEKHSLEGLNVSVKEENIAVGRKIDMKA